MCIICEDLDKGTLKPWEASRNRTEMLDTLITFGKDEDHLKTLDRKIRKALIFYLNNIDEEEFLEGRE